MILVSPVGIQAVLLTDTSRFTTCVDAPQRLRYGSLVTLCKSKWGTKKATTGTGKTASDESSTHSPPEQ
jgi:hypothetical protein